MSAIYYSSIPKKSQWLSDSSVAFARREADIILDRIDLLMEWYGVYYTTNYNVMVIACDLFFTVDYWLKSYSTNLRMDKRRAPAMQALYKCVAQILCSKFKCPLNALPRELELMFGRELSRCGREVDFEKRKTKYMTEKEASQYRLRFKNGKAYQYPWWEENSPQMLVPVESSRSAADGPIHQCDDPKSKFGFFTMSMSRDIYMTKHMLGSENSENGIYHSSYLGGGPVMCAGSMLIAGGVIQKVKSDSGHYKPIDNNMLALLQCLRMLNVSIQNIMVVDYEGQVEEPAPTFFQANADWNKLATERDRTLWEYKYEAKRRADLSKAPNPDADSGNAPNPRDNGARSTPPLETEQTKYTA